MWKNKLKRAERKIKRDELNEKKVLHSFDSGKERNKCEEMKKKSFFFICTLFH